MKTSVFVAWLAVLAVATPALAATRDWPAFDTAVTGHDVVQMITNTLRTASSASASENKDPADKKAYVLVNYKVPPASMHEFVDAFKKTAAPTKQEEGSLVYTLSRTVDENFTFYLYSEWAGMKAVGEHFNSTYLKDYLETIASLNVEWKLHILEPVVY